MAAAANNANAMGFTFEPTYSGTGDKKCSAEAFIQAVEAQRAAVPLNDTQTVAYAIKYLRGDALSYFVDFYPSVEPAKARTIKTDWAEWLAVFKRAYFAVGAATHVTTGWARLRQLQNETVQEFANRTASHLKSYTAYLPPLPADTIPANYAMADADVVDIRAEFTAAIAANAAPTAEEIRRIFTPMQRRAAVEGCNIGAAAQKSDCQQNLLLKVIVNGLTDNQAREMAMRMEEQKKSLNEIVTALRDRERSKANGFAIENKPSRMLARPTITVAEVHDGDDDSAQVDAIGKGRRQGRFPKRSGAGQQSQPRSSTHAPPQQSGPPQQQQPPASRNYEDDHERGAVCGYCRLRNHRTDQCRKKKAGIPVPPPTRQAAIYHNEDSGVFLSGNGESA